MGFCQDITSKYNWKTYNVKSKLMHFYMNKIPPAPATFLHFLAAI